MARRNFKIVSFNGKNFRLSAFNRVMDAMRAAKGQTLFEIADAADVSVQYVRSILIHVPEAKELVANGHVARYNAGIIPAWARDAKGKVVAKKAKLPTSTALVAIPNTIKSAELRSDLVDDISHISSLLRKTHLSPKTQRKALAAVQGRRVFAAEQFEEAQLYVASVREMHEADKARLLTLQQTVETMNNLMRRLPAPDAASA